MSAAITKNSTLLDKNIKSTSVETFICSQCGGNGYMKTHPNCYHTCLDCLGRGLVKRISDHN